MEENKMLTYLEIPNECTQLIFSDEIENFSEEATCLCFMFESNENGEINKLLDSLDPDIFDIYKIAIFIENLEHMPFIKKHIDYIKLSDGLYENISETKNHRYLNISNYIKDDFSKLDPTSVFYFEEFEELKKIKNN